MVRSPTLLETMTKSDVGAFYGNFIKAKHVIDVSDPTRRIL